MKLTGEYRLSAPRAAVWQALNDPDVLQQAIPGCQELVRDSDNAFSARVRVKLGPVSAQFRGRVELSEIIEPTSYTISGEGQGGVAGFAKGGARVTLTEDDSGTTLRYDADGQVGGKIAQVGARLMEASGKKLADEFFSAVSELIPPPEQAIAETTTDEHTAETVQEEGSAPTQALPTRSSVREKGDSRMETAIFLTCGLLLTAAIVVSAFMQ